MLQKPIHLYANMYQLSVGDKVYLCRKGDSGTYIIVTAIVRTVIKCNTYLVDTPHGELVAHPFPYIPNQIGYLTTKDIFTDGVATVPPNGTEIVATAVLDSCLRRVIKEHRRIVYG